MRAKIFVALLLIFAIITTLAGCNKEENKNDTQGDHISDNEGGEKNENSGDDTTDDGYIEDLPDSGSDDNQPHVHSFDVWSVDTPATCTTEGLEISYCSCGESITRFINMYGHSFGEWSVKSEPTCSVYGIEARVCHCGYEENIIIPSIDHNYVLIESTEPDCYSRGYRLYSCSFNCGDRYFEEFGDVGHKFETVTHNVGCEDWGYVEHTCSVCQYNYRENTTPPIGHSYGEWSVTEASFGKDGARERICANCNGVESEKIEQIYYRATYSKRGDYDVVKIDCSAPLEVSTFVVTQGFGIFETVGEYVAPSDIEIIYFGDNVTSATFDGGSLIEVHFSDDVQYVQEKAFWINERLRAIYFEGDAPEIDPKAFNLNGSARAKIYPTEGAKGFDSLLFGGTEVVRSWITKETFDQSSVTLGQYAAIVANYTDALALDILDLYKQKGQEIFLFIPFEKDMDNYKIIKDFTLSLTKNCRTEREKIDTIYDWIVSNISYSDPACYYTSYEVFESKKAVCAGYTTLMHDMLAAVNIPSFYTRGTTVFGNMMSTADVFSRPDDFTTHAWLSVCTSDGKVSYYDPTWGVPSPEEYKNMTAAEVGEYAVTFEIDGLQLMIDGVDHNSFADNDGIHFLYEDGNIYSTFFGVVGSNSMKDYYNYWFEFSHILCDGDHYISTSDQIIGSIYNNGFISSPWIGNTYFCRADGRLVILERLVKYLYMQSYYYGENIDYTCDFLYYDDGSVFFIDHENNTARFICYTGNKQEVVIPATVNGKKVTVIAQEAFKNNDTVRSIVISEGIETFYQSSFEGCSALEYIYIPSTFQWRNGEIETHTLFERCYNLKKIEISAEHPHFTTVNGNLYTKDMTCLIAYAPANDYKVFTIPESVTEIYTRAFAYAQLDTVILHDGLKIWYEAFWHSNIEYITIPGSCELGSYLFHNSTNLKSVILGEGITAIPYTAFNNCQSLTSIVIPSTVKSIGDYAFSGCYTLIDVDLPDGLESIGYGAFMSAGLVSITLPKSLSYIGYRAFDCCYSLLVVNNKSGLDIVKGDQNSNGGVAYHARKLNADQSEYTITVTDNGLVFYADRDVVVLLDFIGCEGDTLILPENFDGRGYYIMQNAFGSNDTLGYVQWGNEILTWDDPAFHYGQAIKTLVIPASVTEIGDYAFEGWANIETIYYGGSSEQWENLFSRLPNPLDPESIPMNDELINATVHFTK